MCDRKLAPTGNIDKAWNDIRKSADAALAALWEKWQEAQAECDLATSAMDNLARLLTQAEAERDLAIDMYGPKGEHDKTLAHIRSILEAHR